MRLLITEGTTPSCRAAAVRLPVCATSRKALIFNTVSMDGSEEAPVCDPNIIRNSRKLYHQNSRFISLVRKRKTKRPANPATPKRCLTGPSKDSLHGCFIVFVSHQGLDRDAHGRAKRFSAVT